MRFGYWIFAMLVSLFASCSNDEVLPADGDEETTSDLVTEVSASCGSFTAGFTRADDSAAEDLRVKSNGPESDAYILGMKDFKDGDKIYILQKGPNLTPKFPGDFFDHREYSNFADMENVEYKVPNIYVYEYNPKSGENPTWSDGFNFTYYPKRSDPISWKTVKENGSIGNSFVFYAFCDNLRDLEPDSDDPLLKYWNTTPGQVSANWGPVQYYHHAYGGKWKKSDNVGGNYDYSNDWHVYQYQNHCGVPDFLGAYHTTSSLYSRLRFKFYHLLAYVRVTLYVPVEQEYTETDPKTNETTTRTTGYDDTAFVLTNGSGTDAEINDYHAGVSIGYHPSNNRVIRTRFTIDWNANRSTDREAPSTQVITDANTAGFLYYYWMYLHNPCDITAPRYKPKTAADDWKAIQCGIGEECIDVTKYVEEDNEFGSGNVKKYLTPRTEDDGSITYHDRVRRYEFSATMPAQTIPTSGTVGGSKTATPTLVDIHVRAPGTTDAEQIYNGTKNNYHNSFVEYTLTTSNLISDSDKDNKIPKPPVFAPNTITHLYIYLPRVADEAILVNAEVLKWKDTHTDMAVAPDDW